MIHLSLHFLRHHTSTSNPKHDHSNSSKPDSTTHFASSRQQAMLPYTPRTPTSSRATGNAMSTTFDHLVSRPTFSTQNPSSSESSTTFTIFSPESPLTPSPNSHTLPLPHISPCVQSPLNPPPPTLTHHPSKPPPTVPPCILKRRKAVRHLRLEVVAWRAKKESKGHNPSRPHAPKSGPHPRTPDYLPFGTLTNGCEPWHAQAAPRGRAAHPDSGYSGSGVGSKASLSSKTGQTASRTTSRATSSNVGISVTPNTSWGGRSIASARLEAAQAPEIDPASLDIAVPPLPLLVTDFTRSPSPQGTPASVSAPFSPRPPTDLLTPLHRSRRHHWCELGMRDRAKRLVRKTAFFGIRMLSGPMGAVIRVGEWVDERRDRKRAEERMLAGKWGGAG
jgi:hypothetical protein